MRRQCPIQPPNSDLDRFAATVRALQPSARPYVVLFRHDGNPQAILIGRMQQRATRHRIGYFSIQTLPMRCLDIVYGGVITNGSDAAAQAILAHLNNLLTTGICDQVTFNHLPVHDRFTVAMTESGAIRRRLAVGSADPHWQLALAPGSGRETIARFSRKHRYNMRRADRLLVEHFHGNVVLKLIERPGEVAGFADAAATIASRSYQAALGGGFQNNQLHRDLLRMEADRRRLRAYLLLCAGEPVAFQLGVVYGDTYHLLATAFLPAYRHLSPGQVLLVRVIRDLSDAGLECIDYGFGDSRYKQIYGTRSWDERTISLYGPSHRASAALMIQRASGAIVRGGALLAERAGMRARLKRWWRARLMPERIDRPAGGRGR